VITICPYTESWIPAVRAFNARLAAGGVSDELRLPEHHVPDWLPKTDGRLPYQEYFLAADGDAVRGGYALKHQDFDVRGQARRLALYRLPLSEGIVDRAYTRAGIMLLRAALREQPLLFALGMGGYDRPLPKMLKAMGWSMCSVPFYFKVLRPGRFLRGIRALRRTPFRRLLLDLAALSGSGWLAITSLQWLQARRAAQHGPASAEPVTEFSDWADTIWEQSRREYALVAVRDAELLNTLYPPGTRRFWRLKVTSQRRTVGWTVVLDTPMGEDKYFGNLRVGSIVDGLARPEHAALTLATAAQYLQERGVDLIVSNQSHLAWAAGLKAAGFLQAPSNFIFAASKELSRLLDPLASCCGRLHLNRGDGDGPIHL
jgi:hypothetical protein